MTQPIGNKDQLQNRLHALWGSVITDCQFQIRYHRLRIEVEARYEQSGNARYWLILSGIASLVLTDGSLQAGKEFYDITWDYAELTSISAHRVPRLGGTFLRVVFEIWSTQIEVLCLDLEVQKLADV